MTVTAFELLELGVFFLWALSVVAGLLLLVTWGITRSWPWRRLRVWFLLRRLRSPGSPGRRGTFLP